MPAPPRPPRSPATSDSTDDTLTSVQPGALGASLGLALEVIRGPDTGRSIALPARPVIVGSSEGCDLQLGDRTVSRRHLEVRAAFGEVAMRDLGSHNGTFVRGVRVVEAVLPLDAEVAVGQTVLAVRSADANHMPETANTDRFGPLLGTSLAMRQLYPLLARLAASELTVLIEGETGTGKEVAAEAMHEHSPRRDAPFVVFDCSAVPANLMEAELFGHERGAFTGAVGTRKGLFEMAQGGTLFIDELGELDLSLQPKLLRAIERREVRRVGGSAVIKTDARIIAATRRDLDHEVQTGRFRDDLFHRFAVARVLLPPLRARSGDVPFLAREFLRDVPNAPKELPADVLARLEDYPWPGNVRELRNAVQRYAALGALGPLGSRSAAAAVAATPGGDPIDAIIAQSLPYPSARDAVLDAFNERYVADMLKRHGGNVSRAAAAAGIARRYFQTLKSRGR